MSTSLTIEQFISTKVLPQFKPIMASYRALINKHYPQLKEEMRGGTEKYYGVPVYRLNRIILTVSPTQTGITFSFSQGKQFEDTFLLLEGVGNKTLNYRCKSIEDYKDEILKYYLDQAIALDC